MKKAVLTRFEELDYTSSESLNAICTNLMFAGNDMKRILMTSCVKSEGKSSISMWMMRNIAERGKNVVLVDTDLRRSFLVRKYGINTEGELTGLAHYLAGMCEPDDIIYKTNIPGAYIIPAGRDAVNPIPLLESDEFKNLLSSLAKKFDMVIVDAPPIGMVVDAATIAPSCDGVVMVLTYNSTRKRDLQSAVSQMRNTGKPILGAVINKVAIDTISAKKYYNRGYYNNYYRSDYYKKDSE